MAQVRSTWTTPQTTIKGERRRREQVIALET